MNWQGSADDKTARLEDATLRVEQMDVDMWWWCVNIGLYHDMESDDMYYEFGYGPDKKSAMQAARKAYKDYG